MATVLFDNIGPRKIHAIKVIREVTGLGLREAKAYVDRFPCEIPVVDEAAAKSLVAKLKGIGGSGRVKTSWQPCPPEPFKTVLLYRVGDLYPVVGCYHGVSSAQGVGEPDKHLYMLEEGGCEAGEHRKYPLLAFEPTHWLPLTHLPDPPMPEEAASEPEPEPERDDRPKRCPHDGGRCHHLCEDTCFRKAGGMSLSSPWPGFARPQDTPVYEEMSSCLNARFNSKTVPPERSSS